MPRLPRHRRTSALRSSALLAALALLAGACEKGGCGTPGGDSTLTTPLPTAASAKTAPAASADIADASTDAIATGTSGAEAGAGSDAGGDDPMALHLETKEALLALFALPPSKQRDASRELFIEKNVGPGSASRVNQGNKLIAKHVIGKAACLAGLAGVTLQTEEQRATCGGMENMVPVWKKGKQPKTCIDIFEFPNKPCELPVVWTAPIQAKELCAMEGKRLCRQEEWMLACRGDPEGGKDWSFAYGDEQDFSICNTNRPAATWSPECDGDSASSAFKTCGTNTEPSGAFPRCRSRFGVFDLHGNVAEIMTRLDADGHVYSQLKGSAFFYVDVAREPDEPQKPGRETYPDQCSYDPRWHVEPMEEAWHVNYHLGFRCCKTVR